MTEAQLGRVHSGSTSPHELHHVLGLVGRALRGFSGTPRSVTRCLLILVLLRVLVETAAAVGRQIVHVHARTHQSSRRLRMRRIDSTHRDGTLAHLTAETARASDAFGLTIRSRQPSLDRALVRELGAERVRILLNYIFNCLGAHRIIFLIVTATLTMAMGTAVDATSEANAIQLEALGVLARAALQLTVSAALLMDRGCLRTDRRSITKRTSSATHRARLREATLAELGSVRNRSA